MRGSAFAVATACAAIAGCGLATSGLMSDVGPSPTPTPTLDGSVPSTSDGATTPPPVDATAPSTTDSASPDTGTSAGDDDDDGGSIDAPAPPPDASCTATTDLGTFASVLAWGKPPAPKIDGDLSDWPCDGRIDLNDNNAAYVKNSGHALDAQIQVRWDKQNLYVAILVADSSVGGGDLVSPYNNDSVEVYVSSDATLNGDYDSVSHQYITDWKGLVVDYGPSHSGSLPDTTHAHFTAASKTVTGGWAFEASLGSQALGSGGMTSFASGTNLALDFEVNDGDGVSQVAAVILTMAPAQATCTCTQSCCCGQSPDVPYCDSARIGRVTLK